MSTTTRRNSARQTAHVEVTRLLPTWMLVIVLIVLGLLAAVPLVYIVLASLNSDLGVARGEFWPSDFTLDNYVNVWSSVGLASGIANSLIVAGTVAVLSSVIALGTAYALVRFPFRGRLAALRSLVGFQSIPGTLLLLPIFVLFASIGSTIGVQIIGTLWGLIITYLTFALPFSTWIMVTYLRGLPISLEEAARIDGASHFGVLWRIVLPLSWPGLIVSTFFAFLLGWNDVMFASVMTTPDTRTVAVALQIFGAAQEGGGIPLYGQMMASSLICAVPVVLLFLIFQRYLVSGLTSGSVK
jgi:trehalose/maltose transport system permease protein